MKSSSDLDLKDVSLLEEAGLRQAIRLRPREPVLDPLGLLKGRITRPELALSRYSGTQVTDIIATTHAVLFLVSQHFRGILNRSGVTGWETVPVTIHGPDASALSGHELFVVKGECGSLDDSRSILVRREAPVPGGRPFQAWVGLYFDPRTWDGSEVFSPVGSGHVFVVDRVREILAEDTSNVRLRSITSIERTVL